MLFRMSQDETFPEQRGNHTYQNLTKAMKGSLLMAGKIFPFFEEFAFTKEDLHLIYRRLVDAIHIGDLAFLFAVAFITTPLFALFYNLVFSKRTKTFEESIFFQISDHISQAARLAIVVYVVDCCVIVLHSAGFSFNNLTQLSKGFAKIIYVVWIAQRFTVFKRHLVAEAVSRRPDKLGRAKIIDKFLDGVVYIVTGLCLLDVLDVQMGVGISGVFAFGSAGTLIVGLATQSIAAMFVNGLALTTSDRFAEGDMVELGDGTSGIVQKIGWMQTTIKHYDELIAVIPNSEIGMQRVKNVSRVKKCRVLQTLRFKYEDAEKLPKISEDILEEIKKDCPEAITDGSSPWRVVWTDFKEDYLSVRVDTHYNLPPTGQIYWENRQKVMHAIYRAVVEKNNVQFVTTFYPQSGMNA